MISNTDVKQSKVVRMTKEGDGNIADFVAEQVLALEELQSTAEREKVACEDGDSKTNKV